MFVFNMKLDGNRTSKIFMGILCVIVLLITCFICYNLISNSFFKTNDGFSRNQGNKVYELTARKLYKCITKCS